MVRGDELQEAVALEGSSQPSRGTLSSWGGRQDTDASGK